VCEAGTNTECKENKKTDNSGERKEKKVVKRFVLRMHSLLKNKLDRTTEETNSSEEL